MRLPDITTARALTVSSGATCTAEINGISVPVQLARDLTVAVGDLLLVHRVLQTYYGCCRLLPSAVADTGDTYDGPDPNTALVTGETVIMPEYTGTYRDSAWSTSTTDTMQGAAGGYGNATGCAFYGDKPASLTGATVTDATVRLSRRPGGSVGAVSTTLWLVTETAQPAGAPTLTLSAPGPVLVPGESVDWPVAAAWAQAMVDGTAGGLGLFDADGSPYARYAGITEDPAAWLLTIGWTRTS